VADGGLGYPTEARGATPALRGTWRRRLPQHLIAAGGPLLARSPPGFHGQASPPRRGGLADCPSIADHCGLASLLTQSGLLSVRPVGNRKHYQANPDSPVFAELCGLAQKTVGLAEPLSSALQPLAPRIDAAFVFGSVAKRQDTATSDIDLMLVSDTLSYADAYEALETASARLGRTVNPTILSRADLAARLSDDNAFVTRVLSQPKIWLIGGQDALGV